MPHVVTGNCEKCKFTDCVAACPVDCFYEDENMLYIKPADDDLGQGCIDCRACLDVCPVGAIFPDNELPDSLKHWIETNKKKTNPSEGLNNITQKQNKLPTADARMEELEKQKAERWGAW